MNFKHNNLTDLINPKSLEPIKRENMVYTTHSGSDIKAVFGNVEVANLSGISISINREVAPIFTMGSPDAVAISKNKRGIAGSIVMQNFDRWALEHVVGDRSTFTVLGRKGAITEGGKGTYSNAALQYSDQIPPFNITLTGMNDYGSRTAMTIYSVNLISEGMSISTEDNSMESQYTFVALGVDWFKPAGSNSRYTDTSTGAAEDNSIWDFPTQTAT